MDTHELMKPASLERYSFLWSEVRLLIAALALFIGGVPPLRFLIPLSIGFDIVGFILTVAWIISGLSALYLGYRWYTNSMMLFGKKDTSDTIAFIIMVVSGLNLGIVGVTGTNIGMNILSSYVVFIVVGVAYVWSAYQLYMSWNKYGQKIF